MSKKIFFLSKDANWQHYRNEVLTRLAYEYDYDIEILTTGKIKDHLKENDRLKYIKFNNWFSDNKKFSFFPSAIAYAIKNKPHSVLCVNNSTQLTEYLALLLCKLFGVKFVWWTHAYDHNAKRSTVLKYIKDRYTLFFLRRSDSVITFSVEGKNYLIANGVNAQKIFPALNTLDTDKLKKQKEAVIKDFDKSSFLSNIFIENNKDHKPITLLFSGRLKKDKKVANALMALKALNDKHVDARLIIVGDGEEREELKSLTEQLKLQDKVHFAGFVFDETLISQYFLASDLFIMPGYVGLAIIHAFAFGLPILTENIPIHSPEIQYLKPGENGYMVSEDNISEMAAIIEKIKNDPSLLDKLRKGALSIVENEANILNMIKNMNLAINPKF